MDFDTKIFKINFISFIKPSVIPFILTLFFICIFLPLMLYTYGSAKQLGAWSVSIILISFFCIPALILHINYYRRDRNKAIKIDNKKQVFILYENQQEYKIKFYEIEGIVKYHSKWAEDSVIAQMPWHTYYFYKIVLKDNTNIYISRLLIEKLENKIEGLKFELIKVLFPIIRINKK